LPESDTCMFNVKVKVNSGFGEFGLSSSIERGIAEAGFVHPRPIQTETIPATLEGRDILGLAQTGTGKTAAFALPVLEKLLTTAGEGPRVLIVAPTRELANQIGAEIRLLARFTRVKTATIFGGVSSHTQIEGLRKNPDIVVACPGRLLDLLGQKVLRLDRIEIFVLDEADRMFDMGFLPDVRRIVTALPRDRQNLLFSATMPPEVRALADGVLSDPHVVELDHSRPVTTVSHLVYSTDGPGKFSLLRHIFAEPDFVSGIVFTRTKHRAKRLAEQLERAGHRAVALQGNMSQPQRVRAMEGFRQRRFPILVATDIAARGIDVEGVSHVINFDMPDTSDAYTHRIGRTGRAEKTGKAVSFILPEDYELVCAIERNMGASIPRGNVEGIMSIPIPESRESRNRDAQPTHWKRPVHFGGSRRSGPRSFRRAS
jgi:ATP-dependent RNA helicase RhlE